MIIEAIAGLILGIIYTKLDDYFDLEAMWKLAITIIAIVVLGYLSMFSWVFMVCFIVGMFLYSEYISSRW